MFYSCISETQKHYWIKPCGLWMTWCDLARFYIWATVIMQPIKRPLRWGLQRANGWAPFDVIQPMYNLVKRQAKVEILPLAQAEDMAVICYGPGGGGLLTANMHLA